MSVARSDPAAAEFHDIHTRLARVEAELAELRQRVGLMDADSIGAAARQSAPRPSSLADGWIRIVAQFGKALIALGVGYLLRSATDAGLVAPTVGAWTGVLYALAWSAVSYRAARRGDPVAAWFAAMLTPALALPLVVEGALRFELWAGATPFVVLAVVTAAMLLAAIGSGQQSIAWAATIGGGAVAVWLMVGLRSYVAAEVYFIAVGVSTLWLGYVWNWTLLRWPAAASADVIAVALIARAVTPETGESASAVMRVLLLLLVAYPASIIVRTILLNRSVVFFEIVQVVVLLALLRGVMLLAPLTGSAGPLVGTVLIGLGATAFATALLFRLRHRSSAINVHFYAALGVVMLLVGTAVILDGAPLAMAWMTMVAALAALATIAGVEVALFYATAVAAAALVPSGVAGAASAALLGLGELHRPDAIGVVMCLALAGLTWFSTRAASRQRGELLGLTAVLACTMFLLVSAGLSAGATIALGAHASTVSTLALSTAACGAMAAAARVAPLASLSWVAYAILAIVGVKLTAGDLRADQPIDLFVALAAYGGAMIATARLSRRTA